MFASPSPASRRATSDALAARPASTALAPRAESPALRARLARARSLVPSVLVVAAAAPAFAQGATTEPQAGGTTASAAAHDPRADYDVDAYRLDLRVEPDAKRLSGTVALEARVTGATLDTLVLDLAAGFTVERVVRVAPTAEDTGLDGDDRLDGAALAFTYEPPRLACRLATPAARGDRVRVAVTYSGSPRAKDDFTGFHWSKTPSGAPWIATSCQDTGSRAWWPGKDSFFHPEDKPARVDANYTVPVGLYAVGNGRLAGRTRHDDGTETFHWRHGYPLETYSVTLNVAPYEVVETVLEVPGGDAPVPFLTYVLPEHREQAALQFRDVPGMLAAYTRAFGPFPFPESKYALVETCFWGMEHSTAVAYGSSFPAWIAQHGGKDPYADRNRFFDYILVHESAHEWWGNAVSARGWGDFWIHEGFATYAEAVYLEFTRDAATAQRHLDTWKASVGRRARLYRGDGVDSGEAYSVALYAKGAWVLHTLRYCVDDDEAWWRTLRAFQREFRYRNATTDDFRAVLERETKRDWKEFFDAWVRGSGHPRLEGDVTSADDAVVIDVTNTGSDTTSFRVPLDVAWTEGGEAKHTRVVLAPGENHLRLSCAARPRDLALPGIERVLAIRKLRVDGVAR